MKGPKGADRKYGCEKVERKTLFCDLFIKDYIYSSEKGCKVPSKVCEWGTDYFCPKKGYERGTISVKIGLKIIKAEGVGFWSGFTFLWSPPA